MPRIQLVRRTLALLAVAGLLLAAPLSAQASTVTLARSVSNVAFSPFDILLSPINTGFGIVEKMRDIEDTTAVQIAYAYPGCLWYTAVVIGGGMVRGVTGLLQFIPAVILLPFETDLEPWVDPIDRAPGLVDIDFELFPVKLGIDYPTIEY